MSTNVSIVIASYNKKEQLEKVLHSINTRVIEGDQIVIVDDGSTDNTQQWLEQLALHDHEDYPDTFFPECVDVSISNREDNGYQLATVRNEGIKRAKNDCIVQLDDDYLLTGNILDRCRELYDRDKLYVIRRDEMDEEGNVHRDKRLSPMWKKWKVEENTYKLEATGSPPAVMSAWGMLVYSKEMMEEIGMYDERMNGKWGGEDCLTISIALYYGIDILYYVGERCVHLDHTKREDRFKEREENEKLMHEILRERLQKDKFSLPS